MSLDELIASQAKKKAAGKPKAAAGGGRVKKVRAPREDSASSPARWQNAFVLWSASMSGGPLNPSPKFSPAGWRGKGADKGRRPGAGSAAAQARAESKQWPSGRCPQGHARRRRAEGRRCPKVCGTWRRRRPRWAAGHLAQRQRHHCQQARASSLGPRFWPLRGTGGPGAGELLPPEDKQVIFKMSALLLTALREEAAQGAGKEFRNSLTWFRHAQLEPCLLRLPARVAPFNPAAADGRPRTSPPAVCWPSPSWAQRAATAGERRW